MRCAKRVVASEQIPLIGRSVRKSSQPSIFPFMPAKNDERKREAPIEKWIEISVLAHFILLRICPQHQRIFGTYTIDIVAAHTSGVILPIGQCRCRGVVWVTTAVSRIHDAGFARSGGSGPPV